MDEIALPIGSRRGGLEALLAMRRTVRAFRDAPLTLDQAATAMRAAGGIIAGHATVPSARRTYPVQVTLVAGDVDDLARGSYRYERATHALTAVTTDDARRAVASTSLDAAWLADCPALLLLSADIAAARAAFDDQPAEHGERFVWLEAGHAAQNVALWAADHRLGAALVAGLDDEAAERACARLLPSAHRLLAVLALGHPVDEHAGG